MVMIHICKPKRCLKMSDEVEEIIITQSEVSEPEVSEEVVSSELELDGRIFLLGKNAEGTVISKEELDGELCLKVVIAVLDDGLKVGYLEELFQASQTLTE